MLKKNIKKFFLSKTKIYLFLGLQKGFPSYRRSFQPSKENNEHFKIFVIPALLDPDPDSESGYGSTDLIESESNPDADPKHLMKARYVLVPVIATCEKFESLC
jgi:hypothetical protein